MEGYSDNSSCILGYLALFQALSTGDTRAAAAYKTIRDREQATPDEVVLAPQILQAQFSLTEQELLLCMAALALEMDAGLRRTFRSRYGLRLPTLEYGLQLLEPLCPTDCAALGRLYGSNPLLGLLLQVPAEPPATLLEYPLLLDRQLVAFLTGLSLADTPGLQLRVDTDTGWLPLWPRQQEQLRAWYEEAPGYPLCLCGPEGSGRRSLILQCLEGCLYGDLAVLTHLADSGRRQVLREMVAVARLIDAPLCAVQGEDPDPALQQTLTALCHRWQVRLIFILREEDRLPRPCEILRLPGQMDPADRSAAWRYFAPNADPDAVPDGAMTVGTLRETAALARRSARRGGRRSISRQDLQWALRQHSGALEFGVRYDSTVTLDDMVLPDAVRSQIRLLCQAARSGDELTRWGLPPRRGGVTAAFHGPSGTGKTMAAGAIAHALGLPLLRADLSRLMDKYVGETEKHLARLLQCARENHCVLLFDEADALFGKRASVSTGQDRYANLSTSFLLQEIEQYDGVALLSTNLLSNFDDAFLRRLHYIVRFPLPDAPLREQLWRRALPPERQAGTLPFAALARAELSPARIHAVVRAAAVTALADGRQQVTAADLVGALRLELEKSGRSLPSALKAVGEPPGRE